MMDQKYKDYLKSDDWAQIRIEIITKRKRCERCGSKNKLQIHHKHYKNIFHEEPEDLELLCNNCHQKEHSIKAKKKIKPKKHLTTKQKKKVIRDKSRLKKLRRIKKNEKNHQRFNLKYQ